METPGDSNFERPGTPLSVTQQYDLPLDVQPRRRRTKKVTLPNARTEIPHESSASEACESIAAAATTRGSVPRRTWFATIGHTYSITAIVREQTSTFEIAMLLVAVGVYLVTRFWELVKFPIYFFCDEAIQTNLAAMLVRNGMRDDQGWWFPPFFLNAEKWNLGWSIYVHTIPTAVFGTTEYVTRGTSVLVSLLGAVSIALMLKLIYGQRMWWLGVLVLGVMPAWFLHSRTAFETVMMVSFYACFLLCYLLYRYRDPNFLYLAVVFGAMTFYSYANGQGVMVLSVVLLAVSDVRYHLRNRWTVVAALVLGGFFILPYARFQARLPDAFGEQYQALNSYWVQRIPLADKLWTYVRNYAEGLSLWYWFVPNTTDLPRHRFKDVGHIWLPFMPLYLLGLAITIRRCRSSAYRALVIALLAVPFSAASVAISITRVLSFVVPATILICLGLEQLAIWVRRWVGLRPVALGSTLTLSVFGSYLLWEALVKGPTWFPDYGIGGMQYGAPQLFRIIPQILNTQPDTRIFLSSTWANNPDAFADYYLDADQRERVAFSTIDGWMLNKQALDRSMLFVMPANEYGLAQASDKFIIEPPEYVLRYPDDSPGFYFVRLQYRPDADTIFAAERAARAQLVEEQITIDGQPVTVRYSRIDSGSLPDLFDDNPNSLMRGLEANPFVIELYFAHPRTVASVELHVATMARFDVRVSAAPANGTTPRNALASFANREADPRVEVGIPGGAQPISKLRIEIQDYEQTEQAHIHVRGLAFRDR